MVRGELQVGLAIPLVFLAGASLMLLGYGLSELAQGGAATTLFGGPVTTTLVGCLGLFFAYSAYRLKRWTHWPLLLGTGLIGLSGFLGLLQWLLTDGGDLWGSCVALFIGSPLFLDMRKLMGTGRQTSGPGESSAGSQPR